MNIEMLGTQYRSTLRQLNAGYILGGLLPGVVLVLRYGLSEVLLGYGSSLSTVVLGLIIAEAGLFMAVFWAICSTQWSTVVAPVGAILQGPQAVVLAVTAELSILAAVMAIIAVQEQRNARNARIIATSLAMLPALSFSWLLITEYRSLSIYANDWASASGLYLLTGLHFGHVCVAIVLMSLGTPLRAVPYKHVPRSGLPSQANIWFGQYAGAAVILYLHFVELIWLGIHVGAYV